MADREEEADRERPLAVADQLAGGVIDRGDVVGVERVPHPQRVGEYAGAHAEHLAAAEVIAPADGGGEQPPAEHVQPDHYRGHAADPAPLTGGQGGPDPAETVSRVCHGSVPPAMGLPTSLEVLRITRNNLFYADATGMRRYFSYNRLASDLFGEG